MLAKCFKLNFPLPRPHCGLVMGNGNFGCQVWGENHLCLTLGRTDCWDHRGGEQLLPGQTYEDFVQFSEQNGFGKNINSLFVRKTSPTAELRPQRVPIGRVDIHFQDNVSPSQGILDYDTGAISILLNNGKKVTLALDLHSPTLLLSDPEQQVACLQSHPAWEFPQTREWLQKCGFEPPIMQQQGWRQELPQDPAITVAWQKEKDHWRIVILKGEEKRPKRSAAKIQTETKNYWRAFWQKVAVIDIPEEFFQTFYQYAVYKFACATHPNGYACGLQGPWHEEYQKAQWSGDYHFNVNVQEIYGPACALGCPEHLLPLFQMIESAEFWQTLRDNAKVLFGIDDGLLFTHAVDDRGKQCGGISAGAVLDPACGAWTALLYWQYWQATGDREFLAQRAWPFIHGVMRCYEEMLRPDGKNFSIPVAISAEYASSVNTANVCGRNPSYQLAAIHKLAAILVEASKILARPPNPLWLELPQRLAKFSLVKKIKRIADLRVGKDGKAEIYYRREVEQRIAIWEGQDLDVCHRHHSHLACIYPFDSLPENLSQQEEAILENSLDHWIGKGMGLWSEWCFLWAAIIYARKGLNEAPLPLFRLWKDIYLNEGLCTVYLPRFRGIIAHRKNDLLKDKSTSEIMQLDGNMGAISAFLEMFAHTRSGIARFFQGVPSAWEDCSCQNIALPGGFLVSGSRKRLTISSTFAATLRYEWKKQIQNHDFAPGESLLLQ